MRNNFLSYEKLFNIKTLLIFLICSHVNNAKIVQKVKTDNFTISPVIFIPGDGGSQLEAKLNKPNVVHYICRQKTDTWFNIWLNMELLVPLIIDCWIDNVRLIYDNVTRTTSNTPGVETRVPGWGDPLVVEWIDPSQASTGSYFNNIANAMVKNLKYERYLNIRGAPYDFRKAPNENKVWFVDMKKLIEDTYQQNNNTAVTLITHSMGSPMALLLLQNLSKEWKRKYVARIISLAGAWAGSVKAVKVFAMGDDLGSYALSGKTLKAEQITSPSLSWLLPSPYFWKESEVLVTSKSKNYTMFDLEQYFNDIDYPVAWEMRKDNLKYALDFSPPDVEIHCIYGSQVPTTEQLKYKTDDISGEIPTLVMGDGDGTVNSRSLKACTQWREHQEPPISTLELPKVDHMKILGDERVAKYILDVLSKA